MGTETRSYATISDDGKYRYVLGRRWGPGPTVVWVMLNPSTADGTKDDQTIRKCTGFTRRWGHDGFRVVNLFAHRATDPAELLWVEDPIGPKNKRFVEGAINSADRVVLAWGATYTTLERRSYRPELKGRLMRPNVEAMVKKAGLTAYCLGRNADGTPRHPRTLAYSTPLEIYC